MAQRSTTLVFAVVALLFAGGGVLALFTNTPSRIVGGLLAGAGVLAICFAKSLAATQRTLADRRFAPSHWSDSRPTLYYLWGTGVSIIGVLLLLGWS